MSGKDKRRGRGGETTPTPVKAVAEELALPVSESVRDAVDSGAELGVVVAFGRIIKPEVLAELPMVNLHFSLLPRWRGAAPVERALLAGDEETGVCLMAVEAGLDEGGIYACEKTSIGPDETAAQLTDRLGSIGARLLVEHLREGRDGLGKPVPQEGEVTYANKIGPEDLRLEFGLPATDLLRRVRVGRAWTNWRKGRLLVLRAAVADDPVTLPPGHLSGGRLATPSGWFVPLEVQGEGRRPQSFEEFLRGARPAEGEVFGAGEPASGTVA